MEKQKSMTPVEIKIAMLKAGVTQVDIACKLGVTPAAVSQVILGYRTAERTRAAVAEAIGMDVRQVWPKPANPPGNPTKRRMACNNL